MSKSTKQKLRNIHPGEVLREEFLIPLGNSQYRLTKEICVTDARYLAHLLRLGILPTGTVLPKEQRAERDLARKRTQLVRS